MLEIFPIINNVTSQNNIMNQKDQDLDRIYATMGRFMVEFELVFHSVEGGVRNILALEGLKNERIQEILLSGLTAYPLSALFRSLCSEYLKPNKMENEIIKQIFSKLQKLITDRNDLVHSKWFLALENMNGGDQVVALGGKLHKSRKGSATKKFKYTLDNFQQMYEEVNDSSWNISKLVNCISGGYPIEKNFEKSSSGEFRAIKGLCKEA